jgi:hypothetical protein
MRPIGVCFFTRILTAPMTGGNFLLGGLLTKAERILEINRLNRVTAAVIGREGSLVIGKL